MRALKHRLGFCVVPPGRPDGTNRVDYAVTLRRRARTTRPPRPVPSIARPAHSAGSGTADEPEGPSWEIVRLPPVPLVPLGPLERVKLPAVVKKEPEID